jgi:hypothetical protein
MINNSEKQLNTPKNQRDINNAHLVFNEVPFCQEYRVLKKTGNLVSFVGSFCSWNTQAFGIGFLSFLWLSSFLNTSIAIYGGIAFGLIGATVLEVVKRIISRLFFKSYYNEEKETSVRLGVSIVTIISLSIGLSFYASLYIPNMVVEAPILVESIEISAPFDTDISELQKERDKYRKNREYLGKLRTEEAAIVLDYNNQIKDLKTARNEALKVLKEGNTALVNDWVTQNNDAGVSIGWFMILLEILCIGGIAFNWYCESETRYDGAPNPNKPTSKTNRQLSDRQVVVEESTVVEEPTEEAGHSADNCQTVDIALGFTKAKKRKVVSLERMQVVDNNTVDHIKRLKDSLSKNYKRSFTSKSNATRIANYDKAMQRCIELQEDYGIESIFDKENQRVGFSNTVETA